MWLAVWPGIAAGWRLGLCLAIAKAPASGHLGAAECWKTSGGLGRSSLCGDYRLAPAPCGDFRLILARDLRGMKRSRRSLGQIHVLICRTLRERRDSNPRPPA